VGTSVGPVIADAGVGEGCGCGLLLVDVGRVVVGVVAGVGAGGWGGELHLVLCPGYHSLHGPEIQEIDNGISPSSIFVPVWSGN
jgi:hypothetical protein